MLMVDLELFAGYNAQYLGLRDQEFGDFSAGIQAHNFLRLESYRQGK